ncbi:hypothetical protein CA952_15645 [Raoultella ornithinolytica]|nr:hypothetical protein CA210_06145 [Raoultella ornithinolytica]ATM23053.1 hypothetical protein CRN13_22860 [Raoultella ornithinolytica]OZV29449.1 hypothetical protein CA956_19895 [Raoultella ornithinolytica]OZV30459.1 hypothetical protein CA952_15645 [Raoultella ornithinolytica]OZV38110.1 hypothetical protein CA954_03885 [Raoultella ornithinolytica]
MPRWIKCFFRVTGPGEIGITVGPDFKGMNIQRDTVPCWPFHSYLFDIRVGQDKMLISFRISKDELS